MQVVAVLLALFIVPASVAETRVVSLAPNLTELVYALGFGETLVGRSSACDVPPEVKQLPEVGGFGTPNLEALIRIQPTLVLVTDLENPSLLDRIRERGIEPLHLPCESWDQLMTAAKELSRALGDPARGDAWVADMGRQRAALESEVAGRLQGRERPRVYVEVWGDPLTTAGKPSFLGDIIRLAGGDNIGDILDNAYATVSSEWVIKENPDTMVLAYMVAPSMAPLASLASRPGWSGLRAIRDGNICWEIPPDLLTRPGPRILEGARALAECLIGL